MRTYVIKNRSPLWLSALFLGIAAGICLYFEEPGFCGFIVVCCCLVSAILAYEGTQTKTISEAGITVKTFLRTTSVSWHQVDKVGAAWMNLGGHVKRYISITWPGDPGKKHWVYRWLWFMKLENEDGFLLNYSDELRDVITRYYGPLDFDCSNDKQT